MNSNGKSIVYKTTYDRSACEIGVVHLGFGAFHRAHQAVYFDDYMQVSGDLRWGIVAINLRQEESQSFADHDAEQPGYLLQSMAPDGQMSLREVRSHIAFADWSRDNDAVQNWLSRPSVHVVTITVTESGYYLDKNGALNPEDPLIAGEISGGEGRSIYACLSTALAQRMRKTGQPLTIMCCDNIRRNGKMLQVNLDAYLRLTGQEKTADWVRRHVTFPCSMVDRITPRSTVAMRQNIEALVGAQAVAPIVAEAFIQWVLEDSFAGPIPHLAEVGVTVTADVDPYEEAKIRILNGGHTCLTYFAALKGIKTFDEAMRDLDLLAHFLGYEAEEVLPGLTIPLSFDKLDYLENITNRFENRAIGDTVERICADGMAKFPIFIRPTLESCFQQSITPHFGLRSVASWYVFAQHVAAGRIPFSYLEPSWAQLEAMLTQDGRSSFVTSAQLWGDLPQTYPQFASLLADSITEMEAKWPV